MTLLEGENRPFPENGNIRIANPADLIRENPAALIVNKESYASMAAHFSPDQFDFPQVVKVVTYSSEHGEVVRDFVLDGMTRTKYVSDNQSEVATENPDFTFRVRDVTASVLKNTKIVPAEERTEGQQALTMLQYLRAVIPPTVEHSQIATDRIAAHLINGWDIMVGESLSRKYSALAALSLLGNRALVNIATEDGLRKDLGRQSKIMAGETIEERVKLQQALVEIAAVILLTKLNREEVARAAFMLVGAESPVIGGVREARKQIYGLLHTPGVDRKLEDAFSNVGEREQMRQQLSEFISESFRRVGNVPNREEIINVLGVALRDHNLKFNHVLDVFTSSEPVVRYDQIREEINKNKLTQNYMTSHRLQELTPVEAQLIEMLGNKTVLHDADISGLVRAIKSATNLLQRAETLKMEMTTKRDELVASGILPQLLDEALIRIGNAQESVISTTSLSTVSKENQRLLDTLGEVNRRMDIQRTIYRMGEMVDQMAGDKLRRGYGPQIRSDVIGLVIGEFRIVEDSNLQQVRQRIDQLTSLDNDLLLRFKNGDISLALALNKQKERIRAAQPKQPVELSDQAATLPQTVVPTPRIDVATPMDITPPTPRVEPPVRPIIPAQPVIPEDVVIDRQQLEERRKQLNRDKLNALLRNTETVLEDIDLTPQDITDVERKYINRIVRRLGLLAYNYPNTQDVMIEYYPHLQEEVQRLRQQLAARDNEITYRDTRTQGR